VREAYRRWAGVYDEVFGAVSAAGRRRAVAAVNGLPGARVLEVGVGTGLALESYPKDTQVTGIDLSAEMLTRARRRALAMPDRAITLALMNAEHMDFPDHSFDCVTLPYVLSVTPDPTRLVHEIRRVCKPGGTILIVNHFSGSRFWWLMERAVRPLADRIGFRSDFSFEQHVLAHDWDLQSVQPVNLLQLSRLVVLRNRTRAGS
jgi:phosphatidylethanolamine/phosphatidyl-N-methylethanolamine N-methyltransferase